MSKASHAELHSMVNQVADREAYLRLAETLTSFLTRLRSASKTLDVEQRQHIVRLLVKEILVDDDTIVIRHSIPTPNSPDGRQTGYLLRKGSRARPCPADIADLETIETNVARTRCCEPLSASSALQGAGIKRRCSYCYELAELCFLA